MVSRDFILEGIRDILANGINLELDSAEEQEAYFELFVDWYTDNTMYYCVSLDYNTCMIETKQGIPMAEISFEDSTLKITPHHEDLFEIITDILRFVAREYQGFIDNFRGREAQSMISSPSEVKNQPLYKEEESSEDEWL
tara:strand:- start:1414 stop:1833 length:420 start_codon:yes stop_codon:yes gene_type:complete